MHGIQSDCRPREALNDWTVKCDVLIFKTKVVNTNEIKAFKICCVDGCLNQIFMVGKRHGKGECSTFGKWSILTVGKYRITETWTHI